MTVFEELYLHIEGTFCPAERQTRYDPGCDASIEDLIVYLKDLSGTSTDNELVKIGSQTQKFIDITDSFTRKQLEQFEEQLLEQAFQNDKDDENAAVDHAIDCAKDDRMEKV